MWGEKTEKASGLLWISHQEAPAELMHYLSYAQARDFKLLLGRREKSSQRELHQGQDQVIRMTMVIILSTCQALC